MADAPSTKRTYLIPLTDDELTAIYNSIEKVQTLNDVTLEEALDAVIHKITPGRVGDPTPEGAIGRA